ncbi:MAG: MFS transporter [Actinomycetota bacterium]|nr:MFS transporter [Actinomycetota bacterium]
MTWAKSITSDTFRSLRIRNYRLFFVGQLVSNSGTWMQTLALGWLVLRMTNSGFAVGVVTALQFLPMLLIGTYGGVIADRLDKRNVLIVTQTGMALSAAGLAVLTLTGAQQLWSIYLLTIVSGCFTAVDMPVRQAFVSEMVGTGDLPNAIALNSAMFNLSRIIGPGLGALVIKLADVGPCFAINAVSFAAVLAGLVLMRRSELFPSRPVVRAKGQVRAGLRYVWDEPALRSTILVMAVVGTLAFNFTVVLPVLAKFTFHGDAATYGWLTGLMGAGSILGALASASKLNPTPRVLIGSCVIFGVLMTAGAFAPTLLVEEVLLVLVGVASMTFMATANSTCQLSSAPEMRGRVMALYGLVFVGSTPIGGPIVGWISQRLGPRYGMGIGGVATILAAGAGATVLLRRRELVRRRGQALPMVNDPSSEPAAA